MPAESFALTQTALSVGLPTIAVLIGILVNNARLTDLRVHVDGRFSGVNDRLNDINSRLNDLKDTWRAELHRVEEVLDARLKHLEDRR